KPKCDRISETGRGFRGIDPAGDGTHKFQLNNQHTVTSIGVRIRNDFHAKGIEHIVHRAIYDDRIADTDFADGIRGQRVNDHIRVCTVGTTTHNIGYDEILSWLGGIVWILIIGSIAVRPKPLEGHILHRGIQVCKQEYRITITIRTVVPCHDVWIENAFGKLAAVALDILGDRRKARAGPGGNIKAPNAEQVGHHSA